MTSFSANVARARRLAVYSLGAESPFMEASNRGRDISKDSHLPTSAPLTTTTGRRNEGFDGLEIIAILFICGCLVGVFTTHAEDRRQILCGSAHPRL
jgi:hypothetical protein